MTRQCPFLYTLIPERMFHIYLVQPLGTTKDACSGERIVQVHYQFGDEPCKDVLELISIFCNLHEFVYRVRCQVHQSFFVFLIHRRVPLV